MKSFTSDPSRLRRLVGIGAGLVLPMVAAKAARGLLAKSYEASSGNMVPENPAHRSVSWKEALLWAGVSGLIGGMARVSAKRGLPLIGLPAPGLDMDEEMESATK